MCSSDLAELANRLSSESMNITVNDVPHVPNGAVRATQVESAVRNWLKRGKLPGSVAPGIISGVRAMYFGNGPGEQSTAFDRDPVKVDHSLVLPHRGILVAIPDDGRNWLNIRIEFLRPRASHTALLWSFAVNVVAFVLATLWISWRFASPLQRLGDAATSLRQGNLKASVAETGPEPVREAARAFNQMALQVSATLKSQQVLMAEIGRAHV